MIAKNKKRQLAKAVFKKTQMMMKKITRAVILSI